MSVRAPLITIIMTLSIQFAWAWGGTLPFKMKGEAFDVSAIEHKSFSVTAKLKVGEISEHINCHLDEKHVATGTVKAGNAIYDIIGACFDDSRKLSELVMSYNFGGRVEKKLWIFLERRDMGSKPFYHGTMSVGWLGDSKFKPNYVLYLEPKTEN